MTGEPKILVLRDAEAIAEEGASRFSSAVSDAINRRGRADVALTGGSAAALYGRLADSPWRERIDWGAVHLWWADDRVVPIDHPQSNAGLVYSLLLGVGARSTQSGEGAVSTDVLAERQAGVPIPSDQLHPFPVAKAILSADGQSAAEEYAIELASQLPRSGGDLPSFDLVIVGVGLDGHLFSVFPGSPILEPEAPLTMWIAAPDHIEPHLPRLTLNPSVLEAAQEILVMVPGSAKAEIVASVLGADVDPSRWPAQLARRSNATWLLDEASAARLSLAERLG